MGSPFLTADWRDLIVVNYEVDPSILLPFLPAGTELDLWEGKAFVSLVAFQFLDTRVMGLPIPFHRNFEEANLRFYVKRVDPDETKRGVVFIKELVPRTAIALVANTFYGEHYSSVPMSHAIETNGDTRTVFYSWTAGGVVSNLSAQLVGSPIPLVEESAEAFILEHYWGYAKRTDTKTTEYNVTHPSWHFWEDSEVEVDIDIAATYGKQWAAALEDSWCSAFVAEGSEISVFPGGRLSF